MDPPGPFSGPNLRRYGVGERARLTFKSGAETGGYALSSFRQYKK